MTSSGSEQEAATVFSAAVALNVGLPIGAGQVVLVVKGEFFQGSDGTLSKEGNMGLRAVEVVNPNLGT